MLIKSGETSTAYIFCEEGLDLAHRHATRVERENLVVEASEPTLVLGNQLRLERALAIARHVDRQRAVVRQDRFGPCPVAMIGGVLGFSPAGRIPEVVRQLAAERTLHDRFLEATDSGIELLDGQGPLPHKLIENLRGNRGSGASGARLFRFRGGIGSPHAMPQTQNS